MRNLFDTGHAALRPLWVRLLVVIVALGWGVFEMLTGAPFWGVIFLGFGAYAAWLLLVTYRAEDGES